MHGGELIHQCKDEFGSIEVIDFQQRIRSLHFGNYTQQSAMLLSNPSLLIHRYAQGMMAPLYWNIPSNVLILGLGAGSITKYLYSNFPNINIDVIELRKSVIDISQQFFLTPDNDEKLSIINQSAFDWIDKYNSEKRYGLIVVDMFLTDQSGKNITVDTSKHMSKLLQMLSKDGVITFNQLGDNIFSYKAFHAIQKTFQHHLYKLDIDSTNNILIASKSPVTINLDNKRLHALETKYLLPFSQYLDKINPIT